MLVDRSHFGWGLATLVALGIASVIYGVAAYRSPDGVLGGSPVGLTFGLLGSALMLYAGAFSWKKRLPRWTWLGSARTWMAGHIWLGLLSGPLILFHCGFRWGGMLEQATLAVFFVVYISGIVGLALQQFLPRVLSNVVPAQAIYEQIPAACEALCKKADALVAARCGTLAVPEWHEPKDAASYQPERALVEFYLHEVRGRLRWSDRGAGHYGQLRLKLLEVKHAMPDDLQPVVDQLLDIVSERQQLQWQSTIHGWLHGWLLLHVPVSVLLLVLAAAHAVASVWY
ncbi:MAG: hypothetical protein KatS3mg110_0803 [Pirellulaceae bacterium]|nr:MAG: hypothetical protein KatS3mg110_0803 [Pirellulaceae bacterium]